MILTCPSCASRYFVDDAKIGPEGRNVKCASCGHRWHAAKPVLDMATGAPTEPDAPIRLEPAPVSALPGDELPKVFRARAVSERRMKQAAVTGVVWAVMVAMVGLLIGAAVIFQVSVVRLWPATAGAYAAFGLPVNAVGVAIEGIRAESVLQEGHTALRVTGMLRNIEEKAVTPPQLQVSLLDAKGKVVSSRSAPAGRTPLAPGQTRPFSIALLDPPSTAKELEVAFVLGKAKAPPPAVVLPEAKAPAASDGFALRGAAHPEETGHAEPAEAEPLPSDSPFVLGPNSENTTPAAPAAHPPAEHHE